MRPRGDESDPGHGDRHRGRAAGEPDRRAYGGVQVPGGQRRQDDLVRSRGHAPAGEHDRDLLAGHRVVAEALHRDPAGLRPADIRVVHAGDVRIGGDGSQDWPGRPVVLAAEAEERAQLPGLSVARRVGGGVGDPGREGERGEHPEDARDRASQRRAYRHRRPAAAGLEREAGTHHHRHRKPGGGRGRRHGGPARDGLPPAGGERQGRDGRRSGGHQKRYEDPAGAEDQPVGAGSRMRLDMRRGADRHPPRGYDGRRDAERRPGRRGQERRRRGRRDGLPGRQAHRLQDLEVSHFRRGVPGHGLADEEHRGQQRRQGEGKQAGGLVRGEPQDRPAEVGSSCPTCRYPTARSPGPGRRGTRGSPRRRP